MKMLITSGNRYITTDGTEFNAEAAAKAHESKGRAAASEKAGRPLKNSEWESQTVEPQFDSRSFHAKVNNQEFRVKLKTDVHTPLESMLKDATERVVGQNPYKGMNQDESLVAILSNMVDDECEEAIEAQILDDHLGKVAPQLDAIDSLIENENWSASSDQKFREQLSEARQTLCEPNACHLDLRQRMKAIDSILEDRKVNRQGELLQRRETLQNELAAAEAELGAFDANEDHGNSEPLESSIQEVTNE